MTTAGYGSSKARGLPGGVKIEDLQVQQADPIPSVTDRNPDVECEFFHTRQVGSACTPHQLCLLVLTASLQGMHQVPRQASCMW